MGRKNSDNSDSSDSCVEKKILDTFGTGPEETARVMSCLKKCSEKRSLIGVFDLRTLDGSREAEESLLFATLKPVVGQSTDIEFQLSVAVACDFLPLAGHCVQTNCNIDQGTEYMNKSVLSALIHSQDDFLQLFLDCGLDLSDFLTEVNMQQLCDLSQVKCLGRGDDLMQHMFPQGTVNIDGDIFKLIPFVVKFHLRHMKPFFVFSDFSKDKTHEAAAVVLFFWALLFQRQALADLFWREGKHQMEMALVGSYILERMSEKAEECVLDELVDTLLHHSRLWEEKAKEFSYACYSADPEKTHKLLGISACSFRNVSAVFLANVFRKKEFAASTACQTKVAKAWKDDLTETPNWKIILCVFLPIFVPLLMTSNSCKGVWRSFLKAPIVVYCYSRVLFMVWVFMLTRNTLGGTGIIILMLFIPVLMFALPFKHVSIIYAGYTIWTFWKMGEMAECTDGCDAASDVAEIVFLLGVYLCIPGSLTVFTSFGPKVKLLWKMFTDICRLLPFGALFVVGFGIAYQSMMYPNLPNESWRLVFLRLLIPYFQMFGENQMEYFEGQQSDENKPEDSENPDNNGLLLLILAAFLIFIKIIYLNIVVAELNCSFQKVEQNSRVIALYELMRMVTNRFSYFNFTVRYNMRKTKCIPFKDLCRFEKEMIKMYVRTTRESRNADERVRAALQKQLHFGLAKS
ncbi:transient receptor potential cation channel subfamily M member-like 2 [Babylonia areolata]|uniref:transient receptor potential cation channel subfamily M member-like 2 n=1 Tax=Babylonia areolata TaxID=304850 RepID=UPI003FD54B21